MHKFVNLVRPPKMKMMHFIAKFDLQTIEKSGPSLNATAGDTREFVVVVRAHEPLLVCGLDANGLWRPDLINR